LVDDLITRTRSLSLDLRPALLDDLGLVPALEGFVAQFRSRTGVAVAVDHDGTPRRLSSATETAAFRIVQEALTNVARHAGTSTAHVRLHWRESLSVDIEDRGTGFDPAHADARLTAGLSGMRQRAHWLGGRFSCDSAPRQGTRVHAELPERPAGA
jgi:signal transduction histidine kinase